jgi:hypothetical protein
LASRFAANKDVKESFEKPLGSLTGVGNTAGKKFIGDYFGGEKVGLGGTSEKSRLESSFG